MEKNKITVETLIDKPAAQVWEFWTKPEHITKWNFAIPEWHCPAASNDVVPNGRFSWRMEAKDGSMGFDYSGIYNKVEPYRQLVSTLDDGRQVMVQFESQDNKTKVVETFEVEGVNELEMQRNGWQAILDNFRRYAEGNQ